MPAETPDERRRTWIEPGLLRRIEDGEVKSIAIDVDRADAYQGNGISRVGGNVILTAAAIRRLYRQLPPE